MSTIEGYKGPYNPKPRPLPDGEAYISIYNYVPSMALGVLAAALFAVAFIGHTYFYVKGRGIRWFQGLMAFGCVSTIPSLQGKSLTAGELTDVLLTPTQAMEIVGYGFRIKSHKNPFLVIPFVIQYFFIVCAPVFISAALYISLQYAIKLNDANLRVSPVKKAFVARAALIGVAESKDSRGEPSSITSKQANNILLAGLALQCASFLVFLSILTTILLRLRNHVKYPRAASSHHALVEVPSDLSKPDTRATEGAPEKIVTNGHTYTKTFLVILYVTSMLIFLRTVYRLAETAEGVWGTASSYEWLFGLLEFAPVIAAVLIWLVRPLIVEIRRMGMGNGARNVV
ncbi:hypothetical protein QFC19_000741 [Naganishia cerealis]|uniref:Uncharacterized protein n=1 Tax=Naganishia cerealis TaxID=610337 RepID=A0ACC2WMM4_9TREE|nr:hypothetical protein QFC19_000741 [Naganishia cerealis]